MKDVTEPEVRLTMLNTGMLLHLRQPSTRSSFCLHLSLSNYCGLLHKVDTSLTLVKKQKAVCLHICITVVCVSVLLGHEYRKQYKERKYE